LSREITNRRAELVVEAISGFSIIEAGLALATVSVCATSFATYTLGAVRFTSEALLTECRSHLVKNVTSLTLTHDESLILSANLCEVTDTECDVLDTETVKLTLATT
jgi:Tfp pilus assembly protein PilV